MEYITKDSEPENVVSILGEFGVALIKNFIPKKKVIELLEESSNATSNYRNYKNPFGDCARFSLNPISENLSISRDLEKGKNLKVLPEEFHGTRSLFNLPFFKEIILSYLGNNAGFMEVVVFTKDHIPDKNTVYGLLHFDRRHQLKFMIYLNDVSKENGAFCCIPKSHIVGKELYYKGWAKTLKVESNNESSIDSLAINTSEDSPTYKLIPCVYEGQTKLKHIDLINDRKYIEGKAGDLVIFDTHLLHLGGFVANGKERLTLKGHTFAYVE